MNTASKLLSKQLASIAKIKSLSNPTVDTVARKVLTGLVDGSLMTTKTEEAFVATFGKSEAPIEIRKESKGKSARFILDVSGCQIHGGFAAKAYRYAESQHKERSHGTRGAKSATFTDEQVTALAELMG